MTVYINHSNAFSSSYDSHGLSILHRLIWNARRLGYSKGLMTLEILRLFEKAMTYFTYVHNTTACRVESRMGGTTRPKGNLRLRLVPWRLRHVFPRDLNQRRQAHRPDHHIHTLKRARVVRDLISCASTINFPGKHSSSHQRKHGPCCVGIGKPCKDSFLPIPITVRASSTGKCE